MLEDFARIFTRDVEVTRRLYRSGDSEYLIDGEVCRLRDVHELLMDTGLGAKAYSIIEQGKIGMILSTRPADRRQLIEEAAGITKYKSRRRAAELKLEAAQQNLTRIDDIVFEVEKQRGTLKRQAAKARRYKRLRDELRRWEKVLFARRYRELAAAIERRAARLARRASAKRRRPRGSPSSKPISRRLRIELAEADQARVRDARGRARARAAMSPRASSSRSSASSRRRAWRARSAEIDDEIRDLEARREPARIALESRRAGGGRGRARLATRPRRGSPRPATNTPTRTRADRSARSRRGGRAHARSTARSTRHARCATPSSTPRLRSSAWPSTLGSSTSSATICARNGGDGRRARAGRAPT